MVEVMLLLVGLVLGCVVGYVVAVARRAAGDAAAGAPGSARALADARVELAGLRAELEAERRVGTERLDAARADHDRLVDQFRSVASEVLERSNEQFLGLAEQRLGATERTHAATLAQREEAVRQMVEPLTKVLEEVRTQVTVAEQARATGHAALGEQVRAMQQTSEQLRSETSRLVTALRASHVRGRWGELQLRRVVEAAGMLPHVDFVEQASTRTDDGVQRPDMVVRLAGGKNVVVDAKVPFLGYLEAVQADDDAQRAARMTAHARHLRRHVDDLASKAYWEQFSPAPEFVVLFVPAEPFLHAALDVDPSLYEYAMERDVVLASPMTLVALLRTVAYGWRQEALAENAQQVLVLGRELHSRLATLGGHVSRLGRQLDGAVRSYNDAVASLESRVLVSARRLADLQVTDADLEAPAQLDRVTRQVQAPELVASATARVVAIDGHADAHVDVHGEPDLDDRRQAAER
ncbi:DNA recombination protein RmuC [Actinotalea sp. Marseille-Q4924]|uniref:DNA recombination protein RmuC n=1 Tax=Actinotalea sp. Marseille-Q4924 TaxID=2866571 RepID=UPI001CE49F79|nr:DNA recombination protein RmuC [Actinotalea sp. Marseille-Q4924]